MISKKLLIIILLCILPFNLEYILNFYNGNMGMYGLYLGIMRKRNIFYLSIPLFLLSCYLKYYIFGFGILFISLYLFIISVYKWKDIILLNI
jgi:hypothetical protein